MFDFMMLAVWQVGVIGVKMFNMCPDPDDRVKTRITALETHEMGFFKVGGPGQLYAWLYPVSCTPRHSECTVPSLSLPRPVQNATTLMHMSVWPILLIENFKKSAVSSSPLCCAPRGRGVRLEARGSTRRTPPRGPC
jgi:hypothetical protein